MSKTTDLRELQWDKFLQRWPLEYLPRMTLAEYSAPGSEDNFCYWLEKLTEQLGSIWGGSSFKFGVYARLNKEDKEGGRGRCYNDNYGWMKKYGATPEDAFINVRNEIVKVAQASRADDFATVDKANLGPAVRWKLAFLYQDRSSLSLIPIYKYEMLKALTGNPKLNVAESHKQLMANRENEPIFEYGEKLWIKANEILEQKPQPSNDEGSALNMILYGPPGTGKTFKTTDLAVEIADPEWYAKAHIEFDDPAELRSAVKKRYFELVDKQRVMFTTFHQSFSYEDFLEGIRADTQDGELSYNVHDGVFKAIALQADKSIAGRPEFGLSAAPNIWKVSIGARSEKEMRKKYLNAGEARIGWNYTGDLSNEIEGRTPEEQLYWNSLTDKNHSALKNFSENIKIGDVLLCLEGAKTIQAVGVVTSDYFFDAESAANKDGSFAHCRKVNWLLTDISFNILSLNKQHQIVQQTVYHLWRMNWTDLQAELEKQGFTLPAQISASRSAKQKPNYVLIIDEINRGNISRIFGELITLLEPNKRKGASDAHEVTLPYSKEPFAVPANLYVIGTMNTADKSLAQLDLALRRRFSFKEMLPDPSLLQGTTVYGIDLGDMLERINHRIEAILDSEHTIGHAYFIPLAYEETEDKRREMLADLFRNKVIPLLCEYFFDDYERIGWVLNCPAQTAENQFIQMHKSVDVPALEKLFSEEVAAQIIDRRFRTNETALTSEDAFKGIIA